MDRARRDRWAARLGSPDLDPLALVADYGVPVVPTIGAADPGTAVRAAAQLGYPVVLKTAHPEARHKMDLDGVRLGLADAAAVRAAHADLTARLGDRVTVQPQVPAGVEIALGVHRDPLVGPLVLVAAGGTLVELLDQRAVALPPVDATAARRMVARCGSRTSSTGTAAEPALPVDAVVDALRGGPPGRWPTSSADHLAAVDVNPLIVHPHGAVAVDALVICPVDAGATLSPRPPGRAARSGRRPTCCGRARRSGRVRGR